MSKLQNKYDELKKIDSSKRYLFKTGIFYIFLQEDAKYISKIFNLKLVNLSDSIVKCGFPENSLQKYSLNLKKNNIDFMIVNINNDVLTNNKLLNDLIIKIKKLDLVNTTVKDAFDILKQIQKS